MHEGEGACLIIGETTFYSNDVQNVHLLLSWVYLNMTDIINELIYLQVYLGDENAEWIVLVMQSGLGLSVYYIMVHSSNSTFPVLLDLPDSLLQTNYLQNITAQACFFSWL